MKTLTVHVADAYNIYMEKGLIDKTGELIREITKSKTVFLVSDTNVFPLYGSRVITSLKNAGYRCITCTFEAGEESKNMKTLGNLLETMAQMNLLRNDTVLALGGGVTGDMAGLASALYMRGVQYVQMPTSLLAQIDSSVGGKTAVDLPQGKNLCGAFHQPAMVIVDPDVLQTLPEKFFSDGMGEAIKYGAIRSSVLFERLEQEQAKDFLEDMIYTCIDIKRIVVEHDEKEHGERKILNFGHTFGHAIEKYHQYTKYAHGEAVGLGMLMACKLGSEMGITPADAYARIENLLAKYGLPTEYDIPLEDLKPYAANDKKCTGEGIQLLVINKIGHALSETVTI